MTEYLGVARRLAGIVPSVMAGIWGPDTTVCSAGDFALRVGDGRC